ncbi:hypothetical protein AMATHDRAFT_61440 [Amanita thiersii Skay4041]|uniref:FAD/NAD(P)-binding domain-containing protein n=1 Tax=Amanita thiersii Skay4041 TaxID=703135 RepID=A0A2A9NPI8_9AGAR|nr:hypothetical protein AMATHDRAFT_61440 [Amanita thiersii Skay4041]
MPNDVPHLPEDPVGSNKWRLNSPIHQERPIKIICIGYGASGLLFAYKLQRSFQNFQLTVYEKNADISGTWYENKYPGCACDIPAHTYTWSFEPNPNWSSTYAGSDEIYEYFTRFSNKYDLMKYCKLKHQVVGARWNDQAGKWNVEVLDHDTGKTFSESCDFLINGTGVLNNWRWPAIPGLEDFKGDLLHTARWNGNVNLKDKHVGIIGNGSSAIQVLPAVHPIVREITTFIRGATWVSPVRGLEGRVYTEEEKKTFSENHEVHTQYRKAIESGLSSLFGVFLTKSEIQAQTRAQLEAAMKEKLNTPSLEDKLIPQWPFGCRRMTPGIGYLETLARENVNVVHGDILRITEKGCVSEDGKEHELDVLICATGFDTSFIPRFPLIGLNEKDLRDEWVEEPRNYLGFSAAGFPNYFMFIGPNSPIGNGPVLIGMEAQADYMLKLISRWQTENIHSFTPKVEAVDDFIAHKDEFMKGTVWSTGCRSWYKSNTIDGKVTALWPGSTLHYLESLADVRYDDWDVRYTGNRFAYLGNGLSQTEVDPTADWAYYISEADDAPYLSKGKQVRLMNKSGTVKRDENAAAFSL